MRIAYFDAFAGVSGDMTVGALLQLGLALDDVRGELKGLPLSGYEIRSERVRVNGIEAIEFDVDVAGVHDHGHEHRPFAAIRRLLGESKLADGVKRRAIAIFTRLAEAEGRVHGVAPDDVEFHEVGAVDAIVDVVATAVGFDLLGIEAAYVSRLPLGSGTVRSQHGVLPVPAPATVELLRDYPVRLHDGEGELVTPTGAAIVSALATAGCPAMTLEAIGYGAGSRRLEDRPNVLRLLLGRPMTGESEDELVLISTNIDDANPEIYEYVMDELLAGGARDVYLTPVHMKKNRPGIVLNVLCTESERPLLTSIILNETTAIGVRYHEVRRTVLPRDVLQVDTEFGPVRVKIARGPDGRENIAPEYEDCRRAAHAKKVALKLVYQAATIACLNRRR
jgi:uncharacterized protein (TIGR00299 family) protein